MFTGIIETLGKVIELKNDQGNIHYTISSPISNELKIDQSIAHNGVCLTVVALSDGIHTVTAIAETLNKSNLGQVKIDDFFNLERCLQMNGCLDGHIVQGHVDQTAKCISLIEMDGSWKYTFQYDPSVGNITVEKGSVCVNGISLTVIDSQDDKFSVAIIPYTYDNTNLKYIKPENIVNLEFDIIGKYVSKLTKK